MYFLFFLPLSGQFLLEQSRHGEAAEMAEKAAELDSSEFDVVFSAAHMLRFAELLTYDNPKNPFEILTTGVSLWQWKHMIMAT